MLILLLDETKIVIINDVRFQSRRGIDWNQVEEYLKEYILELILKLLKHLKKYISVLIFRMSLVIPMIPKS